MPEKKKQLPEAYYKALEELQQTDFTLVELQLYLDTHPNDEPAFKEYKQLSEQRIALNEAFEQKYGPLQHYGRSRVDHPTDWSANPWPWQV
ncbi:MAG: cotJB2 [Paenibacillus sp.]|jgi:spore coat protein JB|nr:cotJB2 [Paenibacillus sp.]